MAHRGCGKNIIMGDGGGVFRPIYRPLRVYAVGVHTNTRSLPDYYRGIKLHANSTVLRAKTNVQCTQEYKEYTKDKYWGTLYSLLYGTVHQYRHDVRHNTPARVHNTVHTACVLRCVHLNVLKSRDHSRTQVAALGSFSFYIYL